MRGVVLLIICFVLAFAASERSAFNIDSSLSKVLEELGEGANLAKPNMSAGDVSVEKGKSLVLYGNTKGEAKANTQSIHFVCTSCHNVVKEDPDLMKSDDPEARLHYVAENDIPFLQGTTLYGAVSRRSFYNGDYLKKYGDLVAPTRNNLREAIQLCALECSQGRKLKPDELESVIAYLWTIDIRLKDLELSKEEMDAVLSAANDRSKDEDLVNLLKSKYRDDSPATFLDPNYEMDATYTGNQDNGKKIYDQSCLHCHENKRYAFYPLDEAKSTFRYLSRKFTKNHRHSVMKVSREGTQPLNGKKAYMPNYTLEKMSKQQMVDLKAYIDAMGK